MPRRLRHSLRGAAFHVMNRAIRRTTIFQRTSDYQAFLRVVREALDKFDDSFKIGILAYCLMPNHWHLVLTCDRIEEISRFLKWTEGTHANRWNGAHGLRGTGALYHARFKAVPVQSNHSILRVCRYVERNPLRKGLVGSAEEWRWSSLFATCNNCHDLPLKQWPIPRPSNWIDLVNTPDNAAELADLRKLLRRSQPVGDPEWQEAVAPFIGASMRNPGRPRKPVPTPFPFP